MRFLPTSDNEFIISAETETEVFYLNNFLRRWQSGYAGLTIKAGLNGQENCNKLDLTAAPDVLILQKAKK